MIGCIPPLLNFRFQISAFSFSLRNRFRRDADGDAAGGKVSCDNRAGSYDAAVTYGDSSSNDDPCSQPYVVADHDITLSFGLLAKGDSCLETVIGGRNKNLRGQGNMVSDRDTARFRSGPKITTLSNVGMIPNCDSLSMPE